jgi:hypothetical protein
MELLRPTAARIGLGAEYDRRVHRLPGTFLVEWFKEPKTTPCCDNAAAVRTMTRKGRQRNTGFAPPRGV